MVLAGAALRRGEHATRRNPGGRAVPPRSEPGPLKARHAADHTRDGRGGSAIWNRREQPDGPEPLLLGGGSDALRDQLPHRSLRRAVSDAVSALVPLGPPPIAQDAAS